ncbi:hypothetical protein OIU79_007894 [Salix purpurea]|uniref:Uncharacterized protein n=1 Tax=Salix purpurea TaxID=77065 RepID=A0A9Q0TH59_SALPP|nr:hypothetical protein OIU79_007894 [Salix purpurea]
MNWQQPISDWTSLGLVLGPGSWAWVRIRWIQKSIPQVILVGPSEKWTADSRGGSSAEVLCFGNETRQAKVKEMIMSYMSSPFIQHRVLASFTRVGYSFPQGRFCGGPYHYTIDSLPEYLI